MGTHVLRRHARMLVGNMALGMAACGGQTSLDRAPAATPDSASSATAESALDAIAAALNANLPQNATASELVTSVCAVCHPLQPPPTLAPPLNMVVRHYMEVFADTRRAEEAIAEWLVAPDPERSGLPEHAIERFGIMPPILLAQDQREAVAKYLIDEFGSADGGVP